jgi:hypothetical protein
MNTMSGSRSKSGLICSHGSELDSRIPRPRMPKTALPACLRKKMGLAPRVSEEEENLDNSYWTPGAGVLAKIGSGSDGSYLKMKSGVPTAFRASAKAQAENGGVVRLANVSRPKLAVTNNAILPHDKTAYI